MAFKHLPETIQSRNSQFHKQPSNQTGSIRQQTTQELIPATQPIWWPSSLPTATKRNAKTPLGTIILASNTHGSTVQPSITSATHTQHSGNEGPRRVVQLTYADIQEDKLDSYPKVCGDPKPPPTYCT